MYTQCPNCATVFRVTAEVLRAAQGKVRCGVCATSFDALENLSERPFEVAAEPAEGRDPADSMTVEELPAAEDIELSSADEKQAPGEPASAETAAAAGEPSLEFHGDAADLDRLFVIETETAGAAAPAEDRDLERTDEFPILVLDERDDPEVAVAEEVVLETAPEPDPAAPAAPAGGHVSSRILIPEDMRQRLAEEAAAHSAVAADFDVREAFSGSPRWPWLAAAAVLALFFAAQVVHSQRESLLRQPGLGPVLAQAYELVGQPLTTPMDLAAYELRQWGAASDPEQPGRLLLRASIVNRAVYAQPYPLLRLALQDRFGANLGVRDIEPSDYLPGESQSKLLGAGERADAEIRIVDPGQEAVGFEMDICLPVVSGVRCANQIVNAAP